MTLLQFLQENNYRDFDDRPVVSIVEDTPYHTTYRGIGILVSYRNNEYEITYCVAFAYDQNYLCLDEEEAVEVLTALQYKRDNPTPQDIIDINRSTNTMIDILNEESGNTGRFAAPDIV